jgi:hypothetical protein
VEERRKQVLCTVHYIADCGCRCQSGLDESRWKHRRIQHNDQSPRCHDCVILMNSTQIRLGFSNENNNHHRSMHLLLSSYISTALGSQQLYHPAPLASMVPQGRVPAAYTEATPHLTHTLHIAGPLDHTVANIHSPHYISSPKRPSPIYNPTSTLQSSAPQVPT